MQTPTANMRRLRLITHQAILYRPLFSILHPLLPLTIPDHSAEWLSPRGRLIPLKARQNLWGNVTKVGCTTNIQWAGGRGHVCDVGDTVHVRDLSPKMPHGAPLSYHLCISLWIFPTPLQKLNVHRVAKTQNNDWTGRKVCFGFSVRNFLTNLIQSWAVFDGSHS